MSYVKTVAKSSSVQFAIKAKFISEYQDNLILVKSTRLEIYDTNPRNFKLITDLNLYGKIKALEVIKPLKSEGTDFLFILTDRFEYCVLSFDKTTSSIITQVHNDLSERNARPFPRGPTVRIDPENRIIILQLYLGSICIIPIGDYGRPQYKDKKNFSLGTEKPTLALLYDDNKGVRNLKTYEIIVKDKEISEGKYETTDFDPDASYLISIPSPIGGVIIVGEIGITYIKGTERTQIQINPTLHRSYGFIEDNGSRILLGDDYGNLYMLLLESDGDQVIDMHYQLLGKTSTATSIVYLDEGCLYLASHDGDQHILEITSEEDANGSHLFVLESFTNIAPILDFLVVDPENQGQSSIVACTGRYHTGALRIIRHGVGLTEFAELPMESVKGVWSLRKSFESKYEDVLVISTIRETRIFNLNSNDEFEEVDNISGFETTIPTLFTTNMLGNYVVQITTKQVRLIDQADGSLVSTWSPEEKDEIILATANPTQIVISCTNGKLVYLELNATEVQVIGELKLPYEIACISVSPCNSQVKDSTSICAIGQWREIGFKLIELPSLRVLHTELLSADAIPRSISLACFENTPYVLIGLGDGSLYTYTIDLSNGKVSNKKGLSLGTKPLHLIKYQSSTGEDFVFSTSDRPTIISSKGKKLTFANVNMKEASYMCSFHSSLFPEGLVIVSEGTLRIGQIDESQRIHVKTVPLGEVPRRIAYNSNFKCFGVCTIGLFVDEEGIESSQSYFRIIDAITHDIVDSFKFEENEMAQAVHIQEIIGDEEIQRFVVGTAVTLPQEDKPMKGKIIIFSLEENRKLKVVDQKEVKGGVFSLATINSDIVVGINSKVNVFSLKENKLKLICEYFSQTCAYKMTTLGHFIAVGDLIHSVTILRLDETTTSLLEVGKDMNSNWISALEILRDDRYICAESEGNLFTLKKNQDLIREEDRRRLLTIGQYHVGDRINQIRRGSLIMNSALEGETEFITPKLIYGTVNGSIGIIATISPEQIELFDQMQAAMQKVLSENSIGGLSHVKWRRFTTEREIKPARMYIDGDLIEQYLDLDDEIQEKISKEMRISGHDVSSSYLCQIVASIMR